MSIRADQALVERGLVGSRAVAKRLILAGDVLCDGAAIAKASELVHADQKLTVSNSLETKYVSRAGLKLEGALDDFSVAVAGKTILDLGQSTGGFTDCVLQRGAKLVVGIDVGHGQLVDKLRNDSRVVVFEECNIRHTDLSLLLSSRVSQAGLADFSLVIIDLSFISLHLILPVLKIWFAETNAVIDIVSLVKPQFEVGKGKVNKQGIVINSSLLLDVETSIKSLAKSLGWTVIAYAPSRIQGGDGNREFFIHCKLNPNKTILV
jgi:23S rRNA (cytidine1920-2'-O)/16S rRNA (cytidine1409-2'-O)-methyltransferase